MPQLEKIFVYERLFNLHNCKESEKNKIKHLTDIKNQFFYIRIIFKAIKIIRKGIRYDGTNVSLHNFTTTI